LQVEQEQVDAADTKKARNRSRTPWEIAYKLVLNELRAPGINESELRYHLAYVRFDGIDGKRIDGLTGQALIDEIQASPMGGVQVSNPLSAELSRLEGEGFGDRLLERLRPEFLDTIQRILPSLEVRNSASQGSKLGFQPRAIVYGCQRQPLSGKPWQVLKALHEAPDRTRSLDNILKTVWGNLVIGEEAVRRHICTARKALRKVLKAAGAKTPSDPIPAVDRGTGKTAWHLDIP
jgi:hypothetical protein